MTPARTASITIAVAALAGLALLVAGEGSARVARDSRASATISCANKAWTLAIPRRRPGHCIAFVDNTPDHAHELNLQSIHWRHWGARRATARAVSVYCCMGGTQRTKVRLRAGRRRTKCGHRAYTRLRVVFKNGPDPLLHPPACRRRL